MISMLYAVCCVQDEAMDARNPLLTRVSDDEVRAAQAAEKAAADAAALEHRVAPPEVWAMAE
jgi:hypothetical protein